MPLPQRVAVPLVPALPGRDACLVASGSASTQKDGASASHSSGHRRPAPPGARRASSCGTHRSKWMRLRSVSRLAHLLEPDCRTLAGRIDERILRAVGTRLVGVAEHGLPERPDRGDVHGVDADLQQLD